mmetsp:Transcript_4115/g.9333  ORF Transcript_4115/g.9333 Transcript_4115/m.9333 type:complete len:494 (-) Transcript_4115:196-1677(-)
MMVTPLLRSDPGDEKGGLPRKRSGNDGEFPSASTSKRKKLIRARELVRSASTTSRAGTHAEPATAEAGREHSTGLSFAAGTTVGAVDTVAFSDDSGLLFTDQCSPNAPVSVSASQRGTSTTSSYGSSDYIHGPYRQYFSQRDASYGPFDFPETSPAAAASISASASASAAESSSLGSSAIPPVPQPLAQPPSAAELLHLQAQTANPSLYLDPTCLSLYNQGHQQQLQPDASAADTLADPNAANPMPYNPYSPFLPNLQQQQQQAMLLPYAQPAAAAAYPTAVLRQLGCLTETDGVGPATLDKSLLDDPATKFITGMSPYYNRKIMHLHLDSDPKWLSDYLCFVRRHVLEVFVSTEEDVRNRTNSKKIQLGQVGIRCRFCAHINIAHPARAGRSQCFPSSLSRIYQSVAMMLREHIPFCVEVPPATRALFELKKIKSCEGSATDSRKYWMTSAASQGMADTEDGGIIFKEGCGPSTWDDRTQEHAKCSKTAKER